LRSSPRTGHFAAALAAESFGLARAMARVELSRNSTSYFARFALLSAVGSSVKSKTNSFAAWTSESRFFDSAMPSVCRKPWVAVATKTRIGVCCASTRGIASATNAIVNLISLIFVSSSSGAKMADGGRGRYLHRADRIPVPPRGYGEAQDHEQRTHLARFADNTRCARGQRGGANSSRRTAADREHGESDRH